MKKAEQDEELNEMRRLYEVEIRSVREIGKIFGVSRQTIYNRLANAGVCFRPKNPVKREIEREVLIQLCVNENLTVCETARGLKTGFKKVSDEIKRHKIIKRPTGYSRLKYPELNLLDVREKVVIPRPLIKNPHLGLYGKARRIDSRISIKRVDNKTFQIKRIE